MFSEMSNCHVPVRDVSDAFIHIHTIFKWPKVCGRLTITPTCTHCEAIGINTVLAVNRLTLSPGLNE